LLSRFIAYQSAIRKHPVFAAPQFTVQGAFFTACDHVLRRSP
jgi:hypothetical protein